MNDTIAIIAANAMWFVACLASAFYAWHIGYEFGRIDGRRVK